MLFTLIQCLTKEEKIKRTKQMQFLDNYLEEYDDPSVEFYKSNFKRLVIKKELKQHLIKIALLYHLRVHQ